MAIFGIIGGEKAPVARSVYYGLFSLQHRGQESAGIVVNDDGVFSTYKDSGLVDEVFTAEKLSALGKGTMAIGHVRYGTLGTKDRVNAEPIVVKHVKGTMAIATSGNLSNAEELRRELELDYKYYSGKTAVDFETAAEYDAALASHEQMMIDYYGSKTFYSDEVYYLFASEKMLSLATIKNVGAN